MKHWKILDYGSVPEDAKQSAAYCCLWCRKEAIMPVVGIAVAQKDTALIFEPGTYHMPKKIQCPTCSCKLELQ